MKNTQETKYKIMGTGYLQIESGPITINLYFDDGTATTSKITDDDLIDYMEFEDFLSCCLEKVAKIYESHSFSFSDLCYDIIATPYDHIIKARSEFLTLTVDIYDETLTIERDSKNSLKIDLYHFVLDAQFYYDTEPTKEDLVKSKVDLSKASLLVQW